MITPKQTFSRDGLTDKRFLVTAFETVKYLGWRIRFISDAGVIAYTDNGAHSWNGEITVQLAEQFATVHCATISNQLHDYGRGADAIHQYLSAFEKLKTALTDDEVDERYKAYKKDFVPATEDTLKPDIRPRFPVITGFLSFFKPTSGFFFTPVLICLNIFIFLIMACAGVSIFEPDAQIMTAWGANATIYTLDGQWWRLLTNCFIHYGVIHLLLNMYALAFVGFWLEPFLGKTRFITTYLLTGIVASLISLWWHDNTVSAGASGAVFGLYGVFLALLSTNHVERSMRKGLLINIGLFVIYNIAYGSFKDGIDNAAHLGGLLSGIVIGFPYYLSLQKPDNRRLKGLTLLSSIVITAFGSVLFYAHLANSDKLTYQQRMQEFYRLDTRAVSLLKKQEGNSGEEVSRALQQGLTSWTRGIALIKDADRLKLSAKLHRRNQILIRYCRLRIKSCALMARDADQQINVYTPQMQQINSQIRAALDALK